METIADAGLLSEPECLRELKNLTREGGYPKFRVWGIA